MTGRGYERIVSSIKLNDEIKKLDIPGACVGVCTKALGGNVNLFDITPIEEGNLFPAMVTCFPFTKGVDMDTWYEIPHGVDDNVELLRSYLEDKGFVEGESKRKFVGHFLVYHNTDQNGIELYNHCVAIPERDTLPRDQRKIFKKTDSWLIIDTLSESGYAVATTSGLASKINELIESGMEVQITKAYLRK